ncbi:hypothetical protein [Acidiphilium sp. AL]|uniref:hypothetical protein n=1 Tax=Acidiphilium sp. AL TaxID=2871704 RepID=UPI0021CB36B3|nr:hypothetical protein [Acidiphilium sp. AL]
MLTERRFHVAESIVLPTGSSLSRQSFRLWHAALFGTICLAGLSVPAHAQSDTQTAGQSITPQEAARLRAEILKQQAQIKEQQRELRLQSLRLNDEQNLLDTELGKLRGTGTGTAANAPEPAATQTGTSVAQASAASAPEAAPITGPSPRKQEARRVLQTAQELSSTGGVLTPKGAFVVDPSFEYDYYNENQVNISGFTIIPGITFGNINVQRVQANYATTAMTFRYGVTNRLELNLRVPLVYATGSTTTQPLGPSAQVFSPGANAFSIGDVVVGGSYQINSGNNGWPILIGNLLFKTTTGTSPFSVPIYTTKDPNGIYIAGIEKKLPTGTGFYTLEPNMTILIPTSPAVLFANILYGVNFARGVRIANRGGGPSTPATIGPGNYLSGTFGVGFAVNNRTSMTFSYQQEHVWPATENGVGIAGSSFDFGTFNFGVGLTLTKNITLNIGAGIGVGPNSPVAKVLFEVPIRFRP